VGRWHFGPEAIREYKKKPSGFRKTSVIDRKVGVIGENELVANHPCRLRLIVRHGRVNYRRNAIITRLRRVANRGSLYIDYDLAVEYPIKWTKESRISGD
jgi:hypothetical protein